MEEEDNIEDKEILGDDYDTYQREREFIEEITGKYHVLIFSKTWCPFCKKLKELFTLNNIIYNSLELDNHANGPNIQDALEEMSGAKRPLPVVFICRKFRGGYSEIHSAWANGTLEEWLNCIDTDFPYDLVVLGGGSGGIAAAKEAAKLGKKVAICDYVASTPKGTTWGLGGTCANVGCIPKALMQRASLLYHDLKDAESFGWDVEPPESHNWESMIEKIQEQIKVINWDFKKQLRELGIAYFVGKGILKDRHTVEVFDKDGKKSELQGTTILIAVGSRPMYLDAIGAEKYCITSDDIFSMKKNPGRTLIIGGGYIAMELASFLNVFGCEVKLMSRRGALKNMDQDIVEKIVKHMETRGIELNEEALPTLIHKMKKDPKIYVEGTTDGGCYFQEAFDTVVIAMGRTANTDCIGLLTLGVELDPYTNKIVTNRHNQTNIKSIFAVGDCTQGAPEYSPVAQKTGKLLAQRLYNLGNTVLDYRLVPKPLFGTLEYCYVGETEEHAKLIRGETVEVYHRVFTPYQSVLSNRFDSRSYIKMICDRIPAEGEKIIGLHVLGPNAAEIVQGFALAIKLGANKEQIDQMIASHPTCAEYITDLSITKRSGKDPGYIC